jgi:uncharacterized membrane protein YbhN (UPF0104 family)
VAIFNNIRMLLLASWLGMAIFFSAAVAPSAFYVLRTFAVPNANEIAGTIVSRTLAIVNISGFIVSLILLIAAFALKESYRRRSFIFQIILLLIVAIMTGVGEWVIAARMRALRAAMGLAIDRVPVDDPNRIAFAALHGYSVAMLGAAIIAALIAFFVMANRVE